MMSEKYNINRYQNVEAIIIFCYCVITLYSKYTLCLGTVQGGKFPFIMQKKVNFTIFVRENIFTIFYKE